jgi:hypothetical protein
VVELIVERGPRSAINSTASPRFLRVRFQIASQILFPAFFHYMERRTSPHKERGSIAKWTLYINELKQLIDHYMALGLPLDAALQAADADLDQFISRRSSDRPFATPHKSAPSLVEADHRNKRLWDAEPPSKFGIRGMHWLCPLAIILVGVTVLIGPHLRHIHSHAKQITWTAPSN